MKYIIKQPNVNKAITFNNNIRCIEIMHSIYESNCLEKFNNNIRCIEMGAKIVDTEKGPKFNNNIRCIEINQMGVFYE